MKKLNELNNEELTLVFHNNRKLQSIVFDDMMKDATFWNTEYLECWQRGTVDYSIGWDRGTFFKCKEIHGFIVGLRKAQKDYCFLADNYNDVINYLDNLVVRLDDIGIMLSDDDYSALENRIDKLTEELETACYKNFMAAYEYCFDDNNVLDYFINCYMDTRADDSYFVDDNYTLFKHIDYIENYQ